uniref:Uncharacterized protein n=1 Tax=Lepeophtheirus salmonis TaxID=72036 RepID=A0A0K2V0A0_LEPSM
MRLSKMNAHYTK